MPNRTNCTLLVSVMRCLPPQVHLNRFDLFHAHLFEAHDAREVGLLFHASEYPAMERARFPTNLGYCQVGSSLRWEERAMDLRNLVWLRGSLYTLDVGVESVLYGALLMDGLQDVRTVMESDFGERVCDVNYFHSLQSRKPPHRIFICQ
jgi:hypothetical protein